MFANRGTCLLLAVLSLCHAQPSSYDDAVARARALITGKKLAEAVTVSEQAIALDEKRWEAYVTAAAAYSAQQLYDDAIGMLQMALGRVPQEKKQQIRDAISEARRQINTPRDVSQRPTVPFGPPAAPAPPTQAEIVLWKSIENSTQSGDYQAYLDAYPNGTYAAIARRRLEQVTVNAPQTSSFPVFHMHETAAVPGKLTIDGVNVRFVEDDNTHPFVRACSLVSISQEQPKSFTLSFQKNSPPASPAPAKKQAAHKKKKLGEAHEHNKERALGARAFVPFQFLDQSRASTPTSDSFNFRFREEQAKSAALAALLACGVSR
jgi:hypothetical protein